MAFSFRQPEFLIRHFDFVGNVAKLMSGKAIAAGIALVTMPIVARLFSPEDFGVAASFLSIVGILSNVSALRYEGALVLPKEGEEAIALMAFSYRILFTFCAVLLAVMVVYSVAGASWQVLDLLGVWAWLIPVGVLLTSALHIQESWLSRNRRFGLVASSHVLGNVTASGTRIALGAVAGSSVWGLISGNLVGMSCRLLLQSSASSEGLRASFRRIGYQRMRQLALSYADFPKLNAPAALVSALGQNLPVLLFGIMFTPAVAGFYAMANRLTRVPIEIVANSMRKVFLQKAAEVKNRGRSLTKAYLLATGGLAALGLIPLICIWLFGQELLTWLLGPRWFEAGRYLEIMAPWLFMAWVIAPSNSIFIVLREQKSFLWLQSGLTALRLMSFGAAYIIGANSEWTLRAYVVVTVVGQLLTIALAQLLISQHSKILNTDDVGSSTREY